MNRTMLMTQMADNAAQRYGRFLDSLKAIYARAISSGKLDQQTITQAVNESHGVFYSFQESERRPVEDDIDTIASEALRVTFAEIGVEMPSEMTEAVSELAHAIESYLLREVLSQAHRDIAFLEEGLRRTLLQVSLAARSSGLSMRAALVQYMIGDASELSFFFHDRRGAKWSSQKFVRGVYRHSLLTVYNETVLLTLADHGLEHAEVEHVSRKSPDHGMILAMSPNGKHPTYSEVRHELFHPNSDALLRKAP